jgi:hypothetical protein
MMKGGDDIGHGSGRLRMWWWWWWWR